MIGSIQWYEYFDLSVNADEALRKYMSVIDPGLLKWHFHFQNLHKYCTGSACVNGGEKTRYVGDWELLRVGTGLVRSKMTNDMGK